MPVAGVTAGPTNKTPYLPPSQSYKYEAGRGPIQVFAKAGKVIIEQLAAGFRPIRTIITTPHIDLTVWLPVSCIAFCGI